MKQSIITSLKVVLFLFPFAFAMAGEAPQVKQKAKAEVVNINTATVEELTSLPRIGPEIAKRILEFRQEHKGFKKVEEIMNIKGIGTKTFNKLKPFIKV
ncbi:MAG: hypothetical protein CSA81_05050 [Acidobacteria bacterium]|nr:MAG: hypothetical protein CSA81_05050 [Acidobacteriota bacterium]PIE91043.1 MAG: hypothetical protein CR997_02685 [Acidobacteriota bacterium]